MQKGAWVTRSCRRRLQGGVKQPRKAESPIPAGDAPWHLMLPMQAGPLLPVTAGLLSPSLPPCSLTVERSRGQSELSLIWGLVWGVVHTVTLPTMLAPTHTALAAVPFSDQPAASYLHRFFFFTPMQLIQKILIWRWRGFHFSDKGCPAQGLRVLSTPVLERLLTLHQHYIMSRNFKTNPDVPERLHDLCALTALEIHFKSRQDLKDA